MLFQCCKERAHVTGDLPGALPEKPRLVDEDDVSGRGWHCSQMGSSIQGSWSFSRSDDAIRDLGLFFDRGFVSTPSGEFLVGMRVFVGVPYPVQRGRTLRGVLE